MTMTLARFREPRVSHTVSAADRDAMHASGDADEFCTWLDASADDAQLPRIHGCEETAPETRGVAESVSGHAGRALPVFVTAPIDRPSSTARQTSSDVLTLRIANGPLAGFTLHARCADGTLAVSLDSAHVEAHLRARARRLRGPLETALVACFSQHVTLEWSNASTPD
ncbi:hypothetical protein [Burkholderia sp. Nafp2/4-1b]|uniref:hypothetical protein n=1 Tax=Burkholderia sp. Nafp2/4-1b TaxID=2116686 RepID=UPI0013CE5A55|nr:hypothetical protein [Burkholderia sp. Nafp2/4-1b]